MVFSSKLIQIVPAIIGGGFGGKNTYDASKISAILMGDASRGNKLS